MWEYKRYNPNELYHYGVKGMGWGKHLPGTTWWQDLGSGFKNYGKNIAYNNKGKSITKKQEQTLNPFKKFAYQIEKSSNAGKAAHYAGKTKQNFDDAKQKFNNRKIEGTNWKQDLDAYRKTGTAQKIAQKQYDLEKKHSDRMEKYRDSKNPFKKALGYIGTPGSNLSVKASKKNLDRVKTERAQLLDSSLAKVASNIGSTIKRGLNNFNKHVAKPLMSVAGDTFKKGERYVKNLYISKTRNLSMKDANEWNDIAESGKYTGKRGNKNNIDIELNNRKAQRAYERDVRKTNKKAARGTRINAIEDYMHEHKGQTPDGTSEKDFKEASKRYMNNAVGQQFTNGKTDYEIAPGNMSEFRKRVADKYAKNGGTRPKNVGTYDYKKHIYK